MSVSAASRNVRGETIGDDALRLSPWQSATYNPLGARNVVAPLMRRSTYDKRFACGEA